MRLGAESAVTLALFVADGKTSDSVCAHPVALVAAANVGLDTRAVDTAVRAYWLAFCVDFCHRLLVALIAYAHVRSYAVSFLAGRMANRLAVFTDFLKVLAALTYYFGYDLKL